MSVHDLADGRVRMGRYAILTVCTANICRSPLMEILLRRRLDPDVVDVASVGVDGWESQPMDPDAAEQLRRLGSDTGEFRSRPLTAKIVESADLILTAACANTAPAYCLSALRGTAPHVHTARVRRTGCLHRYRVAARPDRSGCQAAQSSAKLVDIGDPFQQGELVERHPGLHDVYRVRPLPEPVPRLGNREAAVTQVAHHEPARPCVCQGAVNPDRRRCARRTVRRAEEGRRASAHR